MNFSHPNSEMSVSLLSFTGSAHAVLLWISVHFDILRGRHWVPASSRLFYFLKNEMWQKREKDEFSHQGNQQNSFIGMLQQFVNLFQAFSLVCISSCNNFHITIRAVSFLFLAKKCNGWKKASREDVTPSEGVSSSWTFEQSTLNPCVRYPKIHFLKEAVWRPLCDHT